MRSTKEPAFPKSPAPLRASASARHSSLLKPGPTWRFRSSSLSLSSSGGGVGRRRFFATGFLGSSLGAGASSRLALALGVLKHVLACWRAAVATVSSNLSR